MPAERSVLFEGKRRRAKLDSCSILSWILLADRQIGIGLNGIEKALDYAPQFSVRFLDHLASFSFTRLLLTSLGIQRSLLLRDNPTSLPQPRSTLR